MAGNFKKLLHWGDIIGPSGLHSVSIFSLVIKPQKSPGHPNSPWENLARTHCRHALLCNWTDYASKKIVKEILKKRRNIQYKSLRYNNNNVPVSLQDFFPRLRAHSALSSVLFSIYLFLKKGQFLDILTENRP